MKFDIENWLEHDAEFGIDDYEWLEEKIFYKKVHSFHTFLLEYARKFKIRGWDEMFRLLAYREPQNLIEEALIYFEWIENYELCYFINEIMQEMHILEKKSSLEFEKKDPFDIFKGL